jgi:hypothetical protein
MGDEFIYQPSVGKSSPQDKLDDRSAYAIKSCAEHWATAVTENPLNRLRLLDAKLARPGADVESIKARAGELIRELGAEAVLTDPDCVCLVRQLFGEPGVKRLRDRVKSNASALPRLPSLQAKDTPFVQNSEQPQARVT